MSAIDYNSLENALNVAKQALAFYADDENYKANLNIGGSMAIHTDKGHQARYAIETIEMVLHPDHSKEDEKKYNDALMEHQKASIEKVIKEMSTQLNVYKQQYDELLESGMFFEKFPELTGVWSADKDKFINKLITGKQYGV